MRLAGNGEDRPVHHGARAPHRQARRRCGEEAEAIARRVGETGSRDVEHDVARVLLRGLAVDPDGGAEDRLQPADRRLKPGASAGLRLARSPAGGVAGTPRGFSSSKRFSMRLVSLPPGTHRLSLASRTDGERRRVGLAKIPALAAVLLRHGREQPAAAEARPSARSNARRAAWRRRARASRRHRLSRQGLGRRSRQFAVERRRAGWASATGGRQKSR